MHADILDKINCSVFIFHFIQDTRFTCAVILIESVYFFAYDHVLQDVEVSLTDLANSDGATEEQDSVPVHAIVVDASTFNFIDTQGVNTLLQVSYVNQQEMFSLSRYSAGLLNNYLLKLFNTLFEICVSVTEDTNNTKPSRSYSTLFYKLIFIY